MKTKEEKLNMVLSILESWGECDKFTKEHTCWCSDKEIRIYTISISGQTIMSLEDAGFSVLVTHDYNYDGYIRLSLY